MNSRTERRHLAGPAGRIEVAIDWPVYGGTLDNKVAATLARAFVAVGWVALRPNFRGVGASEGAHDHGEGETADFLHLIGHARDWLAERAPPADAPRALAGFSFGSFVAARAARTLAAQHQPVRHLVLVGSAAGKWPMPEVRRDTLVIHGEQDETIPLVDVLDWARPQELPVVVLPGADHFFHRRLGPLKQWVIQHLLAGAAIDAARDVDINASDG
ncbi:MAG: alpha/beta hydrolase [Burkholderiaceae bacterium]|nr:alpha/beta hydrolase [Burkholderiaceae bacterium]